VVKGYLGKFEKEVYRLIEQQMPAAEFFGKWPSMKDAMWVNGHMYAAKSPDDPERGARLWFKECIAPRFQTDYEELNVEVPGLGTRVRIWEREGYRLEIYDTHNETSSHWTVAGVLYDNGRKIFDKAPIDISKIYAVDEERVIPHVLSWFTLKPGDTDADYFNGYTKEQLEWCEGDRNDWLRCLQVDLEEMLRHDRNDVPDWACEDAGQEDHEFTECETCYQQFCARVI